jgi:hypothetical protein
MTSRTSLMGFNGTRQNVYISDEQKKIIHKSKMKVSLLSNLFSIMESGFLQMFFIAEFAGNKKYKKKTENYLHCFDSIRVPICSFDRFFCTMEKIYLTKSKNFLSIILKSYNLNFEDFFFDSKLSLTKKNLNIKNVYRP